MPTKPMPTTADWRVLADIGGTNARFGLQRSPGAAIEQVRSLPTADHATLQAALAAYLQAVTVPPTGAGWPGSCAIGIATPVTGDQVSMTNHPWCFSQSGLRQALGFKRLLVINDFTALALAVPVLAPSALRQVGGGNAAVGAAKALIGPGTGLGVSGLVPVAGATGVVTAWAPVQGEGGHVTLAAETTQEAAVLGRLRQRHGHVSAERVLSGPGLAELAATLAALAAERLGQQDQPAVVHSAADVLQRGLDGADAVCVDALTLFCGWLGSVAGNLALTLGARGGVYIGGGIVPRLGGWLDGSPFRQRFEAKGRFQAYLAAVPCWVIDGSAQPALLGAAQALDATPA